MYQKSFKIFSVFLFIFLFSTIFAAKKSFSGKDLFKEKCRVCHQEKEGQKSVSPSDLIQKQWETFFEKDFEKIHRDLKTPKDEKPFFEFITKEELEAIKKFIIEHAADTERPETCG